MFPLTARKFFILLLNRYEIVFGALPKAFIYVSFCSCHLYKTSIQNHYSSSYTENFYGADAVLNQAMLNNF